MVLPLPWAHFQCVACVANQIANQRSVIGHNGTIRIGRIIVIDQYKSALGDIRYDGSRRMLDALKIAPTVTLNARVCETYPAVVRACIEAGWELNAHGYDQVPMHKLEDQKAVIDKSVAIISLSFGAKRHAAGLDPA